MRSRIFLLCLICFWVSGNVGAQQAAEEHKFVVSPNDMYLLTVASQSGCPIQVENAKFLLSIGPGSKWGATYRLRNVGTKPLRIQAITLSMWTAMGLGASWQELTQDKEQAILPGELITIREHMRQSQIVSLTEEIRDKLSLRGPLRAVVVLMVEQVKFSDGSVYNDERTSKALRAYLQNVDLGEYKPK